MILALRYNRHKIRDARELKNILIRDLCIHLSSKDISRNSIVGNILEPSRLEALKSIRKNSMVEGPERFRGEDLF